MCVVKIRNIVIYNNPMSIHNKIIMSRYHQESTRLCINAKETILIYYNYQERIKIKII